jgi:hypothetical protein
LNNRVAVEEKIQKIQKIGGKLKRLLQILCEKGWIDNSDGKAYRNNNISGKKMNIILSSTTDFTEAFDIIMY